MRSLELMLHKWIHFTDNSYPTVQKGVSKNEKDCIWIRIDYGLE